MVLLLVYCGLTTMSADFPVQAQDKWSWVWKSMVFAIFLPLTLRTRLRIEATALVMVLAAASIIISGAIKTLAGGGGYGMLHFFVNDNTGLFEGSTLSTVAIAIIPLILWLRKHGTIFAPEKRVDIFAYALIAACILIPIGTQARTGLICAGLLAIMMLRSVQNRMMYIIALPLALLVAVPLLPSSFTARMSTIQNNEADESASTRMAVWSWTLGYATDHPFGGGFDSYRSNKLKIETRTTNTRGNGNVESVEVGSTMDRARAFHSAYFEMLGEQGWPGLLMWLTLQITGLIQLEGVQRRLRKSSDPKDQSDASLASALQQGHIVYLFGALFVGIAYQPFIFMLLALQIGLVNSVRRRHNTHAAPMRAMATPEPQGFPANGPRQLVVR
jgi:probable O-glycosylation ligase (exosortase A-associated)